MIELIPAYGRTYSDTNAMEQAWLNGSDFKVRGGGPYCSIRDVDQLKSDGYQLVRLYPNMLQAHFLTKVL